MEVILLQDVEKLGKTNQLVEVKSGYGRNFLIPQKLALLATKTTKNQLANKIKKQEEAEAKAKVELQAIAETLSKANVQLGAKTGKDDKIFGSVTTLQLAEAIKTQLKIEVDRRKITFVGDVKKVGAFSANIELHPDIQVELNFEVVSE